MTVENQEYQVRKDGRLEYFPSFDQALRHAESTGADKVSFTLGEGRLILRMGGMWEYWTADRPPILERGLGELP